MRKHELNSKYSKEKDYFKSEVLELEQHDKAIDWLLYSMFGYFVAATLFGYFFQFIEFSYEVEQSILILYVSIWIILFIAIVWMNFVGHIKHRGIIKHRINFQKQDKIVNDIEAIFKNLYFKEVISPDSQIQTSDGRKLPGYDDLYQQVDYFVPANKEELSDEIKKRIKVFADCGREENKEACVAVLTGFEENINVLKPIKKIKVILKQIQDYGYLIDIESMPGPKTMNGWIDSYRTTYYPNSNS